MRRTRLILSVGWLLTMAMAAPVAPVADEAPPAPPIGPEQQQPEDAEEAAPPAPPATEPVEAPTAVAPPIEPEPAAQPGPAAEPDPPGESASGQPPAARKAKAPRRAPTTDRPTARAAAPGFVTIEDFSFGPATVTVGVGESVTWRNDGPSAHTATADDGSFDTGLLQSGQSRSVTFDEAGSFSYLCEPHPFMKGSVSVVAQASGDAGDDPVSSGGGSGTSGTGGTGSAGSESTGTELPATGSEPGWLAVTGFGLLLIGASGMRRVSRSAHR